MPRVRPPRRNAAVSPRRVHVPQGGGGRFTPDAIEAAVRELEAGVPAPVVCRHFGVSDRTLYRWRRQAAPRAKRPA